MSDVKVYRDDKNRVTLIDATKRPTCIEIDQAELMLRMLEAMSQEKRPAHLAKLPPEEVLERFIADNPEEHRETVEWIGAMALAAIDYLAEILSKGTPLQ